jgi:hypothetical protein
VYAVLHGWLITTKSGFNSLNAYWVLVVPARAEHQAQSLP